jgi:ubiquitin
MGKQVVTVRVTDAGRAWLDEKAQAWECTQSEILRAMFRLGAQRDGELLNEVIKARKLEELV